MNSQSNSKNITILIESSDQKHFNEMLTINKIHFEALGSQPNGMIRPFGLDSVNATIISLGTAGVITAISKCILGYLSDRKRKLTIKSSKAGISIVSENYTVEDLAAILSSLKTGDTIIVEK